MKRQRGKWRREAEESTQPEDNGSVFLRSISNTTHIYEIYAKWMNGYQ
jgi:hypothetical protein